MKIQRLPVIAFSAGAAPAVQMALRHPERISALVLFVPGAGGLSARPAVSPPRFLPDALYRFDFPMWALMRIAPRMMYTLVAVPASLVPSLSAAGRAKLEEAISIILPVSQRRLGVLNDGRTQAAGIRYPLEQISTPTLLFSAADDLYDTLLVARDAAGSIPNAKLIEFSSGGHLLLDRADEVWPAVATFLRS